MIQLLVRTIGLELKFIRMKMGIILTINVSSMNFLDEILFPPPKEMNMGHSTLSIHRNTTKS